MASFSNCYSVKMASFTKVNLTALFKDFVTADDVMKAFKNVKTFAFKMSKKTATLNQPSTKDETESVELNAVALTVLLVGVFLSVTAAAVVLYVLRERLEPILVRCFPGRPLGGGRTAVHQGAGQQSVADPLAPHQAGVQAAGSHPPPPQQAGVQAAGSLPPAPQQAGVQAAGSLPPAPPAVNQPVEEREEVFLNLQRNVTLDEEGMVERYRRAFFKPDTGDANNNTLNLRDELVAGTGRNLRSGGPVCCGRGSTGCQKCRSFV